MARPSRETGPELGRYGLTRATAQHSGSSRHRLDALGCRCRPYGPGHQLGTREVIDMSNNSKAALIFTAAMIGVIALNKVANHEAAILGMTALEVGIAGAAMGSLMKRVIG